MPSVAVSVALAFLCVATVDSRWEIVILTWLHAQTTSPNLRPKAFHWHLQRGVLMARSQSDKSELEGLKIMFYSTSYWLAARDPRVLSLKFGSISVQGLMENPLGRAAAACTAAPFPLRLRVR